MDDPLTTAAPIDWKRVETDEAQVSPASFSKPFLAPLSLVVVGLLFGLVVGGAPLLGWPRTVRGSVVIGVAILLLWLSTRPWTWRAEDWRRMTEFEPSRRHIAIASAVAGLLLTWIVVTLFKGGHINAVDFTVYFDRPLYQTIHGHPLLAETTEDPTFDYLTHLGVHAYWLLLPLSSLYLVRPSPYWLLVLSVIAAVAGSLYVFRIGRQARLGQLMSCAAALAVLLNDNTARTLRYGFHPEVLYLWFLPWLIDAGLRGARRSFVAATIATVMVKEDAILPLIAVTAVLALTRGRTMTPRERLWYLVMPPAVALVNLSVFYMFVVPALWPHTGIAYAGLWANYGASPIAALVGMASRPASVAADVFTSGLLSIVLPPFLFLPLVGWRWSIGTVPLVAIFAASANDQLRGFGVYYATYLVPFFALAAADGAHRLAHRLLPSVKAAPVAAGLVVVGALVIGPGYALRPWRAEIAAVPGALDSLPDDQTVLVQSGLYPHAGYDARVRLLTPHTLADPANRHAALLIAPRISAYPFAHGEINKLARGRIIFAMPSGLTAVRNKANTALTVDTSRRVERPPVPTPRRPAHNCVRHRPAGR